MSSPPVKTLNQIHLESALREGVFEHFPIIVGTFGRHLQNEVGGVTQIFVFSTRPVHSFQHGHQAFKRSFRQARFVTPEILNGDSESGMVIPSNLTGQIRVRSGSGQGQVRVRYGGIHRSSASTATTKSAN